VFSLQLHTLYKNRDAEVAREINQALTPDYMVWNLKADAYLFTRSLVLSLQVNNLFNLHYSDILGASMPGRWIQGGIAWKFYRDL
jgi:iron complex outermembrane receptor protein